MRPDDRENKHYAEGWENPIAMVEEFMFEHLPDPATGNALLDVGCGMGTIAEELESRGFRVKGLDFAEEAVKRARARDIDAQHCDVDASGLPFDDREFDIVWAGDIVEHVFDPRFLLEEMHRVLKPGGRAFISLPNDINLKMRLHVFLRGISPQTEIYRQLRQCKHHTVFSFELLEFMLASAGFDFRYLGFTIRYPKTTRMRLSRSKFLGRLLGQTIMLEATKP